MITRHKNNVLRERRTRSKTSDNTSLSIPVDVLIDIFSRLPLKSIAIFRCVSKLWSSILCRPDFTNLFLTHSSTRPQLLFARQKGGDLLFFSSPQPQNPDENSSLATNPLMCFSDFNFGELSKISGPVHGLFCLVDNQFSEGKRDMVPVLCSPSTGQTLILPKVRTRRAMVKCLLGYDPVDKQFKVLSMTQPLNARESRDDMVSEEHQVLTLGTGKMSWRMIQCCIPHLYPREAICINGVLYYTSCYEQIACFHVRSEKFSLIEVNVSRKPLHLGAMINYNGKLGLILSQYSYGSVGLIKERSSRFRLWVLEDVGKQEWSERIYVLPPSWENIVAQQMLKFVGVARTNEIVLSPWFSVNGSYLIYFNPESNTLVRVDIEGLDMGVSNYALYQTFVDHVEDVKLYPKVL